MKRTIWLVAIGLCCSSGHAQPTDCSIAANGTFTEEIEPGVVTTYERTADVQVENTPALGLVTWYRVRWADACTYQLFDKKVVAGIPARAPLPSDTVTVRVISVDSAGFNYEVTSNYADLRLTGHQWKVKAGR
jgi:hypothetical protein